MKKIALFLIALIFFSASVFAPPQEQTIVTVGSHLFTWPGTSNNSVRTEIVSITGPQAVISNGQTTYSPIVLQVNFGNNSLYNWFNTVRQGTSERRTVQLFYYNSQGSQVVRYDITGMLPYKYTLKEDPATRRLTEEYEFAYTNFTRN
ncbi:MAG: phage tail protein [Candidatus Diapherotrites archaeon]|nr:phage tail protein [Candidatus Diapherotrites archaeon]